MQERDNSLTWTIQPPNRRIMHKRMLYSIFSSSTLRHLCHRLKATSPKASRQASAYTLPFERSSHRQMGKGCKVLGTISPRRTFCRCAEGYCKKSIYLTSPYVGKWEQALWTDLLEVCRERSRPFRSMLKQLSLTSAHTRTSLGRVCHAR